MNKTVQGRLGLLIVAMIWGTGFVASFVAVNIFTPLQIMALRFTLSAILASGIFYQHFKKMTKGTVFRGIILGIFLYLAFLFQTIGLQYTTPSKNAFLTAVNVVLVPIFAFLFLRHKLQGKMMVAACFTLLGVGFLSLEHLSGVNKGDIYTLVCAAFFAIQILFTDLFLEKEEAIPLTIIQLATASILGILGMVIGNEGHLNLTSGKGWLAILYLGAISTMFAYLLQTHSQQFVKSSEAAIILATESLFGMLASVVFLKEALTFRLLIGASLIFCGILLTEIKFKPKKQEVPLGKEETHH